MRYGDFLRTSILLFGASATVLGAVALVGAHGRDESTLVYMALALWALAALYGGWIGRRPAVTEGIAHLLASARTTPLLPELQPGTILFGRLWGLALFTAVAGGLAFLAPQVPAIGAAFPLIGALYWRRQGAAVAAIEERDGVRFYVEHNSPFKPMQLVRTPGFRKNEPSPTDVQGVSSVH
jgi:hypothetical protein